MLSWRTGYHWVASTEGKRKVSRGGTPAAVCWGGMRWAGRRLQDGSVGWCVWHGWRFGMRRPGLSTGSDLRRVANWPGKSEGQAQPHSHTHTGAQKGGEETQWIRENVAWWWRWVTLASRQTVWVFLWTGTMVVFFNGQQTGRLRDWKCHWRHPQ